jgi:hypothetical protein
MFDHNNLLEIRPTVANPSETRPQWQQFIASYTAMRSCTAQIEQLCESRITPSCGAIIRYSLFSYGIGALGACNLIGIPDFNNTIFLQIASGNILGGIFTSCLLASLYLADSRNTGPRLERFSRDGSRELFNFHFDRHNPITSLFEWIPICGMQAVAGTAFSGLIIGESSVTPTLLAGLANVTGTIEITCLLLAFKGCLYCVRRANVNNQSANVNHDDLIVTRSFEDMSNVTGMIPYISFTEVLPQLEADNPQLAEALRMQVNQTFSTVASTSADVPGNAPSYTSTSRPGLMF